ncbi:alpha-1-antitrypsin-like [Hemicordylus capensis]|uniref:alpha-1-antitrypsin-like n=1 Tax=Hemicordylus capensis TaxID=884348 RepID=UPI002303ED4E|nr:alpha-1-antitrypsin-like [Hemicordylus capensis]XP_053143108.1 alpha-1-antitrypsin-like [Hemicordylus capensis]XP_053143109.1 alpha-1-antitrypsin-like [Hemicordylus capensis]
MKAIFLLFFLTIGICANRPYPYHSGYPNNNDNSCDNYGNEPYPPNMNRQIQGSVRMPNPAFINSNSNFAFKFLRQASNGAERSSLARENLVFSPMCISSAFAMLALGAKANTLNQILRTLSFTPAEIQESMIHQGFHDVLYRLNNEGNGLQVETGSCLFVENKLRPQQAFLDGIRNIYGGELFMEDFKNAAETEQHINSYIEKKTHGMIPKLVDQINPITEVLLVSYIYMKAKWKKPFNPKYTELHDFYVNPYTAVKVPMMFQMGMFENCRDDEWSCTVLKMPYDGHAAAFFILPDPGQLDNVVNSLSCEVLQSWKRKLRKSPTDVYIPKCTVSGKLNLKGIMYPLGIVDVFTDKADLSGITGKPQHRLSEAVHKAVMMIDERGTEASAASSMDIVPMSMPATIKLDRPFLILIADEKTSSILFMSKMLNPSEKQTG